MKGLLLKLILFLLIFILKGFAVFAQPPCATNPVANDYCSFATPICNLNGYCGNTSASYGYTVSPTNSANENNTPLGNVFCANIQNNSWLKFIASGTTAVFNVWCMNCTINHGIQMQIYATTDCYNFTSVSNCWNPGYPTNGQISATGLTPGNVYYFMIDGNYGDVCDYVIACNVGVSMSPSVTSNQTICSGATSSITAAGGVGYTWASNPPDPALVSQMNNASISVSPSVTTTYTVTVSNTGYNTFCTQDTAILNSVVTVNTIAAQLNGTTPSYCGHFNGSATVAGMGGTGTYSYLWSTTPPQNTASVAGLASGTYTVTITSGGCPKTLSVYVPEIAAPVLSISSFTNSFCSQSNGTAVVQTVGGTAPFNYVWNTVPVQNNDTLQNVSGGTYTVTVTDSAGCASTQSVTITEIPGPTVTMSPLTAVCLNHSPFVLSGGSPSGGTYSGTAVTNNLFDPAAAGVGIFTIGYIYTDANNCSGMASQPIQVYAPTPVVFAPIAGQCVNSPSLLLNTAAPAGGTYFGQGVVNGSFNPQIGIGSYTISYYYTNTHGCSSSGMQNVTVSPLPVVTQSAFQGICINASPQVLSGGTPVGGTYSGPGVVNGLFNPTTTGLGVFVITYSYQDLIGCVNHATDSVSVYPVPAVAFAPLQPVCINVTPFQLQGGTPAGGTYIGPGITSNIFNPAVSGQGTFQIIYDYLDQYGCGGSDTQTIAVNLIPTATMPALGDVCANDDSIALSGGSPAGGYYTGPGVANGYFNPVVNGSGTFSLGYVYADSIGCSDTAFQPILVKPLPDVQFAAVAALCLNDSTISLTMGTPAGGTYSGAGVSNGFFNPSVSGSGVIPVEYSFTGPNGCTDTANQNITVNALPLSFQLNGGGTACDGTGGLPVGMEGSQTGVEYSLILNGLIQGFPFTGTGFSFTFGNQEAQGNYTIHAIDPVTGCIAVMSDTISLTITASPYVELGDSLYLCDLPEIILDAGSFQDSVYYEWQDGSVNQKFTVVTPGNYWVKIVRGSCYGIDTVDVLDCSELEYPNIFTPNSDLKNDRFLPKKYGEIFDFNIEIYNRWGKLVYKSTDLEEGWDGTNLNNGEDCSEGVYFYVVSYIAVIHPQSNRPAKLTGSVTLLR